MTDNRTFGSERKLSYSFIAQQNVCLVNESTEWVNPSAWSDKTQ